VNIGDALCDQGKKVLLVDADPQCNLTAFFIDEPELEEMLGESEEADTATTIWSAIKLVVQGRGGIRTVPIRDLGEDLYLIPGDVLLAQYEEELPQAWLDSFGRKTRGYDVMAALSMAVSQAAAEVKADVVLYDVGPNVGALNRAILLDSDYFITPVAADLFSLRALTSVGRAIAKWIVDWGTVQKLADPASKKLLLRGRPAFLGYVTSAYKVASGRSATNPHSDWEKRIAPHVRDRIVEDLRKVDPSLVPSSGNKLGAIKNFHSLAVEAQKHGVAIGKLRGRVNPGNYAQIDEADAEFQQLAHEIVKRTGI
jgi:cellulose biosynthesis protein BcsQ